MRSEPPAISHDHYDIVGADVHFGVYSRPVGYADPVEHEFEAVIGRKVE